MEKVMNTLLPYKIVREQFVNTNNKKRCVRDQVYNFLSLVIMLYSLSLAINRIQRQPPSNVAIAMMIILLSLCCSPCYLLFELADSLMKRKPVLA